MSSPHAFVVLYAGETVADARIAGASAEQELVHLVAERMLLSLEMAVANPVSAALEQGQRIGLQLLSGGSAHAS